MKRPPSDGQAFKACTAEPSDVPASRLLLVELAIDEVAGAVDTFEADSRGLAPYRQRMKSLGERLTILADGLRPPGC